MVAEQSTERYSERFYGYKESTPTHVQHQKDLIFSPSKQSPASPFYASLPPTISELLSGHQRIRTISTADKLNAWYIHLGELIR